MSVARRTPADLVQLVFNAIYQKLQAINLIDDSQQPQNKLTGAQSAKTKFAAAEIAKIATQFALTIQSRNPATSRKGVGANGGGVQRSLTSAEMDELNQLFADAFPT